MPALATGAVFLVVSAFLASTVEMVEALTIVLAVGVSRQWRSTLIGVGAALGALAAVIAALGPALALIPIDALRVERVDGRALGGTDREEGAARLEGRPGPYRRLERLASDISLKRVAQEADVALIDLPEPGDRPGRVDEGFGCDPLRRQARVRSRLSHAVVRAS